MIDILFQFVVLLGIAVWLPAPEGSRPWLGARFALAGYIGVIYLFVGSVALGLPLSILTWAALAIGLTGLITAFLRPDRHPAARDLAHPVFMLTALFFAVAASRGEIAYQPYLGDETASWLSLTKQIYLADHYRSDLMDYHLPNYTNGWPLMLAATSSVYSNYDAAHAVSLQFFMHLGIVAFLYDIVRSWISDTRPQDELTATLAAWIVVVVFLAGEITWRLLPTDLLIEQPMLYAYAACFLVAIVGQHRVVSTSRLSLYWGVVLCAGYLFKISMLAIAPTIALFVLMAIWRDIQSDARPGLAAALNIKRLFGAGALAFAPLAAAMAIWMAASPGDVMDSSVGPVQASNLAFMFSADGWRVTLRMLEEFRDYGLRYKLPLTIIAGVGMFYAAWSARWRTALFGFFIFVATTWAGLYLYYLFREPFLARGYLESFPRFAILPIRLFHLIGFLALIHAAIRIILPLAGSIAGSAAIRLCLVGAIGIGLMWQVREMAHAVDDMTDRRYQSPASIQALMQYKASLAQIEQEVARLNLAVPKLAVFDPRSDVATTTASYYSLKTRRELATSSYRHYKPTRVYLVEGLAAYDILWLVGANESEAARIADYLIDPACAARLIGRILIRVDRERFTCLQDNQQP